MVGRRSELRNLINERRTQRRLERQSISVVNADAHEAMQSAVEPTEESWRNKGQPIQHKLWMGHYANHKG